MFFLRRRFWSFKFTSPLFFFFNFGFYPFKLIRNSAISFCWLNRNRRLNSSVLQYYFRSNRRTRPVTEWCSGVGCGVSQSETCDCIKINFVLSRFFFSLLLLLLVNIFNNSETDLIFVLFIVCRFRHSGDLWYAEVLSAEVDGNDPITLQCLLVKKLKLCAIKFKDPAQVTTHL